MYSLLTQSVLAARNSDDESGWIQLLVFIIVAVIYAIGGILKARSNKQKQQKAAPRPQPRPRLRPQPQVPHIRPRPHIAAPAPKPPMPRAQPAPSMALQIEPQMEAHVPTSPPKRTEPDKLLSLVPELDEPETLKRAILYYEILGRPLSLRQPEAPIIGR